MAPHGRPYRDRWHLKSGLDEIGDDCADELAKKLTAWSWQLGRERLHLLLCLWQECWRLWDGYLIYRTLQAVGKAVGKVTEAVGSESPEDWEAAAWRAAGRAISLITADASIFQRICLSDADGLARESLSGVATTKSVIGDIRSALDLLSRQPAGSAEFADGVSRGAEGLRYLESLALESQLFYDSLGAAASALVHFETWLAEAPRLNTGQPRVPVDREPALAAQSTVLESIDDAIERFDSLHGRLGDVILSRAEPWERLLAEIREIVAPHENPENIGQVFAPRSISIRYCYPFAVDIDESSLDGRLRRHELIKDSLSESLASINIEVRGVRPLDPTAFFAAQGADSGLYGGVRVRPSRHRTRARAGRSP